MLTLIVAYLVAVCLVLWVWSKVSHQDRVMTETADDRMWERSIDEFTARVQR